MERNAKVMISTIPSFLIGQKNKNQPSKRFASSREYYIDVGLCHTNF